VDTPLVTVADPRPPKSGLASSETWIAVGAAVAGLVVAIAPLFDRKPDEAQALAESIRSAAAHLGGLATTIVSVWQIVKSRTAVKVEAIAAAAAVNAPAPKLVIPPEAMR
jgi:hypothetical protein